MSEAAVKLLDATIPAGRTFRTRVERVLQREEFWTAWKSQKCPQFEKDSQIRMEEFASEQLRPPRRPVTPSTAAPLVC